LDGYLDEENVCSCFGEGDGHGLADASCAACDEGGLALEGEEFLDGCHVVDVVLLKVLGTSVLVFSKNRSTARVL
jgi:hypothetical protein